MNILTRFAAALLGAACIAEGVYLCALYARARAPDGEFLAPQDRLAAEFESRNRTAGSSPLEEPGSNLGKTLEEWFRARAGDTGVRSDISTTDTHVVISFLIPGLKAESLHISVNKVRVTISCVANHVEEKKDARGAYRREAMRQYEMIMPIPVNADPSRHRVVREGEAFKIIFEKLDDPTLKS